MVDIAQVHEARPSYLRALAAVCAGIVVEYRRAIAAEEHYASLKRRATPPLRAKAQPAPTFRVVYSRSSIHFTPSKRIAGGGRLICPQYISLQRYHRVEAPANHDGKRIERAECNAIASLGSALPRALRRSARRNRTANESPQSVSRREPGSPGAESDSVYLVVSGRFEVWIEGQQSAINEIGVGEPIGEIGFFARVPRTATIVAARDSVVIELDRRSFDDIARQVPAIYQTLLRTLARRLAASNTRIANEPRAVAARTVAVVAGGSQPVPRSFHDRLRHLVERNGKGRMLSESDLKGQFPKSERNDSAVSDWLNAIELDTN